MKINKDTRIAFLSTIIGDGTISSKGSATIKHSSAQKDYVEWKFRYLSSKGITCFPIRFVQNSGDFYAYTFCIKTTSYSKLYRRILYKNGSKNFYKRKLLNHFKEEHLAIWYMDDGGLSQLKRDGRIVGNELMLNTHTTKENNQILIDYFKDVWGVQFSQCKNRGHYRLRCGTKEARKFLNIVRPYVDQIPSMSHKLAIKSD